MKEELKKMIEEYDNNENVFYRFQCRDWEIGAESWGMIYSTREEAIEAWMEENECDYEEAEEAAILPGKSCMDTFENIMTFSSQFDYDCDLLVFHGHDTYVTGHDGEYVAEFIEEIARISMDEAVELYNDIHKMR